jgi:integrase
MPAQKRFKTDYPGVAFIMGISIQGKPEKIFMIRYRKGGKMIEEKAGRQFQDAMTPARAATIRAKRLSGKQPSNKERREAAKAEAEKKVWTLSLLWEEYKVSRSPKSIVSDDNRFKNHIEPAIGQKQLKDIVPLDLDRIRLTLMKTRKAQTVAHVMEIIRRVSNFAVVKRLCPGLNFKVQLPKFDNRKTEDLTPEQLGNLLKAIDEEKHNPHVAKMLKVALFTGLRRREIFGLKWSDVDFDKNFLHLHSGDTKDGRSHTLPLNPSAREVLESTERTESPYIFPGRDGGLRMDAKHQADPIKKRAGLPKDFRVFHGLRHVYASMLASSGKVDMFTLQKLLTHKSPQMVQRYAHLRDDALRRASDLAGELVNEAIKQAEAVKGTNVIALGQE